MRERWLNRGRIKPEMEEKFRGRKNIDKKTNVEKIGRKLIFWNIAGLGNKDIQVWEFLEKRFISLTETWIEETGENYCKNMPSRNCTWKYFSANRDKKKVGLKGGF